MNGSIQDIIFRAIVITVALLVVTIGLIVKPDDEGGDADGNSNDSNCHHM